MTHSSTTLRTPRRLLTCAQTSGRIFSISAGGQSAWRQACGAATASCSTRNTNRASAQQRTHSLPPRRCPLIRSFDGGQRPLTAETRPLASGSAVSLVDIFQSAAPSRRLLISTTGPHGPGPPPLSSGSLQPATLQVAGPERPRSIPTHCRHPCLGGAPRPLATHPPFTQSVPRLMITVYSSRTKQVSLCSRPRGDWCRTPD